MFRTLESTLPKLNESVWWSTSFNSDFINETMGSDLPVTGACQCPLSYSLIISIVALKLVYLLNLHTVLVLPVPY